MKPILATLRPDVAIAPSGSTPTVLSRRVAGLFRAAYVMGILRASRAAIGSAARSTAGNGAANLPTTSSTSALRRGSISRALSTTGGHMVVRNRLA
jgi:hypothetical protein